MNYELVQEYDNPDYPVKVQFVERKKDEPSQNDWLLRPIDAELVVVNNGELKILTENRTVRVLAGQAAFISCNVKHRVLSSITEDTAFYSVIFSPHYVVGMDEESLLYKKYYEPVLMDSDIDCLLLDEANLQDEMAIDRINDIIVVNTMKRHGYEVLTKGFMSLLWAILLEYMDTKDRPFNGRNVPSQDELRVRSAIQYIHENYQDPITLEDISDKVHVSRNECCRCFKRVLNISPVDYLIRFRVFQAARVIYKDPLSVETFSDLAFQTGFNSMSYFNKIFKRFLNMTPTEFKRLIKNNPEMAKKLFDSLQESVAIL